MLNLTVIKATFLFLFLTTIPSLVYANFYRYIDDSEQINITNNLDSVPKRYRTNMTVVTDKQLEQKAATRPKLNGSEKTHKTRHQQSTVAPAQNYVEPTTAPSSSSINIDNSQTSAQTSHKQGWLDRQLPFLKLIAIAIAAITAIIVLSRIASALAPRPLAIVIKVALSAALLVYFTKGYANKVSEAFARIKSESAVAQKAVDKRSEKIENQAQ